MKKPIEFKPSTPDQCDIASPWQRPEAQFQDLILKPAYKYLKAKLPQGIYTIRVLPMIQGGKYWWMPIEALPHTKGHHPHPKTTSSVPDAQSVFDVARSWLKQNAPRSLYDKSTGNGFKLWSNPMAACWLIVQHGNSIHLKLLLASAFAGTRHGRNTGLAHQILMFVKENPDLLNPDTKHAIEITRSMIEGGLFPETRLQLKTMNHTLNETIAELPSEELRMICPIEQTIRQIEPEEEWKLLERTIGSEWTSKIRAANEKQSPEGGDRDW